MKIEIETKFSIGDAVKFIYSDKMWSGTIASVSTESDTMEEVAGMPVTETSVRYSINVNFLTYKQVFGPFGEDQIRLINEDFPFCTDANEFKK